MGKAAGKHREGFVMTETIYISEATAVHGSFGFHSRADHFASCPDCNGTYEKQKIKKYTGRTDGRKTTSG